MRFVAAPAMAAVIGVLALQLPQATTLAIPTSDGGVVHADRYGEGTHGVVLVHGGRFDKESWTEQAATLAWAGLRVLAIDLRGYGDSHGPDPSADPYADLPLDVLAAVHYLRRTGAGTVSVVGASLGGWAAGQAAIEAEPGQIDRLVLLAASPVERPERMPGRKLFVVSRDDRYADGSARLTEIRDQYERAGGPKELLVLDGSAHAQFVFDTDEGKRLMDAIVAFLVAP